jgi:hypothetical protein
MLSFLPQSDEVEDREVGGIDCGKIPAPEQLTESSIPDVAKCKNLEQGSARLLFPSPASNVEEEKPPVWQSKLLLTLRPTTLLKPSHVTPLHEQGLLSFSFQSDRTPIGSRLIDFFNSSRDLPSRDRDDAVITQTNKECSRQAKPKPL